MESGFESEPWAVTGVINVDTPPEGSTVTYGI